MGDDGSLNRGGLFHLGIVYVVWGSTYLAIRVAVRDGSGFPPFAMAGMRVLVAAALLLGWGAWRRQRLRLDRGEVLLLSVTGLLLWTAANGLVTWGERRAASGLAALLVASMPIWAAAMEAHLDRRRPTLPLVGSLLAGFAGVVLLSVPVLRHGTSSDVWAVLALLAAPLSWAAGSIWMQRRKAAESPTGVRSPLTVRVMAGYQQLFGGVGFLIVSLLVGEPRPDPVPEAWLAWGYLVVFGSVLAFTSYVTALRLLPLSVTMTYAYANPVIAVFLGWLLLKESVTLWTLAGAVLVIAGVAGVFHERSSRAHRRKRSHGSSPGPAGTLTPAKPSPRVR